MLSCFLRSCNKRSNTVLLINMQSTDYAIELNHLLCPSTALAAIDRYDPMVALPKKKRVKETISESHPRPDKRRLFMQNRCHDDRNFAQPAVPAIHFKGSMQEQHFGKGFSRKVVPIDASAIAKTQRASADTMPRWSSRIGEESTPSNYSSRFRRHEKYHTSHIFDAVPVPAVPKMNTQLVGIASFRVLPPI